MANLNRTEVSTAIQALTAIVGETEHKESLDENFAQSVVFRKDVSETDTATATTKTLDFLDVDYIEVTQSANVAYTLNNIQQGELKYLKIIKGSSDTITFANANNQTFDQDKLDTLTEVYYLVINKDGSTLIAIPLLKDVYIASTAEAQALTDDTKVLTPAKLADVNGGLVTLDPIDIGDWDMSTIQFTIVDIGLTGTDILKIRRVDVMIQNDDEDVVVPLNAYIYTNQACQGGAGPISDTGSLTLACETGGYFDNTDFDSTSFNRGWITIHKLP